MTPHERAQQAATRWLTAATSTIPSVEEMILSGHRQPTLVDAITAALQAQSREAAAEALQAALDDDLEEVVYKGLVGGQAVSENALRRRIKELEGEA